MSAGWVVSGVIAGIIIIPLAAACYFYRRDKARWPFPHPGEWDDHGVDGDSIARIRRSQRKLDAARDRKLTEGIEQILSEADGNG